MRSFTLVVPEVISEGPRVISCIRVQLVTPEMISGGPRVNFMHTSSFILVAPEMISGGPRVNFMHTSSFILVAPEIISEDPRVNFMHTSSFILVAPEVPRVILGGSTFQLHAYEFIYINCTKDDFGRSTCYFMRTSLSIL